MLYFLGVKSPFEPGGFLGAEAALVTAASLPTRDFSMKLNTPVPFNCDNKNRATISASLWAVPERETTKACHHSNGSTGGSGMVAWGRTVSVCPRA
jgi:hypothetical protein